jgi:hypothetical protein
MIELRLPVQVECRAGCFFVREMRDLQFVMGSTAVAGNLSFYGVRKVKGGYEVPFDVFDVRLQEMRMKCAELCRKIMLMEQLEKEVRYGNQRKR